MKALRKRKSARTTSKPIERVLAFTLLELMVVIAAVILIFVMLLSGLIRWKHKAAQIDCVTNLKTIGMAFRVFAHDHEGLFPMKTPSTMGGASEYATMPDSAFRQFQSLSNDLGRTGLIICPNDNRFAANTWSQMGNSNSSYFVGLDAAETNQSSFLCGDRNLVSSSRLVINLSVEKDVKWHPEQGLHGNQGNVAFGDGHVEKLDSSLLKRAMQNYGNETNRLAVP